LGVDEEKIEEWLNILEKQGVIKIERLAFGKIRVKYVR